MAKRLKNLNTRIPIHTLSSGVGRQAPSKRLPTEAENIDNAFVTLERSVSKRSGFSLISPAHVTSVLDSLSDDLTTSSLDLWFYLFDVSEDVRFLIVINFNATTPNSRLMWSFKITDQGWWNASPNNDAITQEVRDYITFREAGSYTTARESLRAISIGQSIMILNRNVKAGFSSPKTGPAFPDSSPEDSQYEILNGGSGYIDGGVYWTSSSIGAGLKVIPAVTDGVITGIISVVETGDAYPLNQVVTIGPGHTGEMATMKLLDIFNPTFDLSGTAIGVGDVKGRPISYYTSVTQDPQAKAEEWNQYEDYLASDLVIYGTSGEDRKIYEAIENIDGSGGAPDPITNTPVGNAASFSFRFGDTEFNAENDASITLRDTNALVRTYIGKNDGTAGAGQFECEVDASTTGDNFVTLVNGSGGHNGTILATNSNGLVTITQDIKGEDGNTLVSTDELGAFFAICDTEPPSHFEGGTGGPPWSELRDAGLLLVEDWVYPDPSEPDLGQAVSNFSDIKFPPLSTDMTANNGVSRLTYSDDRTELTLKTLYPSIGDSVGRGKIYFSQGAYLSTLPGYYRIISKSPVDGGMGRPYTQRVRTPDEHSYIDPKRMPMVLSMNGTAVNSGLFTIAPIEWDARTTGTIDTNPGPAIFTKKDGTLRHVSINSLAFYRGRLFLSAEDTLFSSRTANFDNLWINDSSNITSSDPLDLQASSNKYSRINAMIPFSDYLFINTDSDTQFELMGSENQITPFTAELAATSFYSTSPLIDPVLMGSQIYFFSPKRMFIYFSQESANINTAVEISTHCPDYLPSDYSAVAVAASRDTIAFVDKDNPNYIYFYTNRFSGDRVIQNAFSRWILNPNSEVLSLSFFNDNLYAFIVTTDSLGNKTVSIEKATMTDEDPTIPRIDHRYLFTNDSTNTTYSSSADQTIFTLPYIDPYIDEAILQDGWGNREYERQSIVSVNTDYVNYSTIVTIAGNYSTTGNTIYFGRKFNMNIELSPIFYRDKDNNIINGVLNLKTLSTRHFNSGPYKISVTRRSRSPLESTFFVNQAGTYGETIDTLPLYEKQGEFTSKVYGYASEVSIAITSDFPTPCNITNIELKGKFKPTYSSVLD